VVTVVSSNDTGTVPIVHFGTARSQYKHMISLFALFKDEIIRSTIAAAYLWP
jgi:hypothetical protein